MKSKFKKLETTRLIFRKVKIEDTQILWDSLFNNYDKYKFYEHERIKNYEDFKEKTINQIKRYEDGNYYRWAIIERKTGELIGNINLHHFSEENNNANIGYYIFDTYCNKGYASESVLKIVDFAFNELKIHRITGGTIADNIASNKVLLKTGFSLEGIKKEDHIIDGKYYDSHIYAILNMKE